VKAAGRAKIVMESPLNKDSFSRTGFLYERIAAKDHAIGHWGSSEMEKWTSWNNFRPQSRSYMHAGNHFGYTFNDD
jgi:hypothetical protein